MPSIEFSDSYRISASGYPTNYIRVDYTEVQYDATRGSYGQTQVRLDGVYIKSTVTPGSCTAWGTLQFNGTTVLTMASGAATDTYVSTSYALIRSSNNGATVWISHDADGKATLAVTLAGGYSYGDAGYVFGCYSASYGMFGVRTSKSKSASLTTRPVASTIASSSASVSTLGTYSLTMNRKSSSNYHIATFKYNNSTVLYTSGHFDTQLDYVVPRSWFANYSSIASLPVTVSVQTYNSSGTAIGAAATASLTVNADADMKPVVSSGWASLAPYNTGEVSGITGYVKSYSQAEATFDNTKVDMTNAVGASIASFSVTCQGETDSNTPYLTPVLTSTSVSVICTVTDTRGRTASETFTLTVMDYAKPALTGIEIFRCDAQGTAAEDGTHYSAKATLTYSSLNGQNAPTLVSAVAASGGSYGTDEALTSGTAHISTAQISADASYMVRITATDSLGNTAVYYQALPTRKWAMKFRPTGNGVAFGKAAEYNNTFEITEDWDFRVHGKEINTLVQEKIFSLVYPVGSIYMSVNSADPGTLFGGTWEQLEDRFLLAAGTTYTAGDTGGEETHQLTEDEMPIHNGHLTSTASGGTIARYLNTSVLTAYGSSGRGWTEVSGSEAMPASNNRGGSQPHNNMPPYLAVYMWKRTA